MLANPSQILCFEKSFSQMFVKLLVASQRSVTRDEPNSKLFRFENRQPICNGLKWQAAHLHGVYKNVDL